MANFLTWEWCGVYWVSGLVVLYVLRMVSTWLRRTRSPKHWHQDLVSTFMPTKAFDWLEELKILPGLVVVAVLWPVAAVFAIKDLCGANASWRARLPEAKFSCKPPHLLRAVSRAEAEILGTVIDPLGRAPALPFGHLNSGWMAFLSGQAADFALWYFEVPREPAADGSPKPRYLRYRGFAWVKGGKVGAEFVFEG